jgi:arabinofuranosyltransferase
MKQHLISRAGLAFLLFVLLCHELALGLCIQDDAFISFRYARNLSEGHGLVYNIGERVEGYTNFLWTVLMALIMKLGLDVLPVSRFTGILFSLGTMLLMYEFSRTILRRDGISGLLGAAFLALNGAYATAAVQGLETPMFVFLVFAGQYCFLREESERWRFPLSALPGLASLTRPEAVLVFGATMLFRALSCAKRRERPSDRDLKRLIVFAVIFLPYFGWRYAYYGFPLPNTFYAKVGWGPNQVWRGVRYVGAFLNIIPFVLLAVPLFWLQRRRSWIAYSLLQVASYTVYVVSVGGDFKPTFRFMLPVLPLVCLWLQESAALAVGFLKGKKSASLARAMLLGAIALSLAWTVVSTEPARLFAASRRSALAEQRPAGEWLYQNLPRDSLLASSSAGVIPYYARLTTIDMWGLTDLHIAHTANPYIGYGVAGH